jgi:hypothetical protein
MAQFFMADKGQKGGAMFTAEQNVIRPLECVWKVSDDRLVCVWVERTVINAAGNCRQEEKREHDRQVA